MSRQAHLVVSGTYRSGTTFVERLVDNLSDGFCAPQPFPFLYLNVKREFLARTGRAVPRYPIGPGFHDPSHHPAGLTSFLRSEVLDRATIAQAFNEMRGYSGAQTPELAEVVHRLPEGTFATVVRAMHSLLAESRTSQATVLASKEILVEEFVPSFVEAAIATLLVVRDPRAVAASCFGPASPTWTGRPRPLLYTVRMWRKSVAYALTPTPMLAFARLEDFITDPAATLVSCLHALGIVTEGRLGEPWLDERGNRWERNSSFPGGTTRESFGLSERQLAYVEALTRPEMVRLGYPPLTDRDADDALGSFRGDDDPGRFHPAFERDLSVNPAELALERERLRLLRSSDPVPDEADWFVRTGVRARLACRPT